MAEFNANNIRGVVLAGGKTLHAESQVTVQGLKVGETVIPGLRLKTNVEGRKLWAFAPFSAIVGIVGTAEGEPSADASITFDAGMLAGVFIVGGRLLRIRSAAFTNSVFGGPSLSMTVLSDVGREEATTIAVSQVTAFLGDFLTDIEREEDELERKATTTADFVQTFGTDSDTYNAAMAKQTTYDKKTKETYTTCAACGEKFPPPAYHVPVFIKGVGITHRNLPCNPYSRRGLLVHNGMIEGD
ncbi:MAG: hypothetical protein ACYDAN_01890 [Candidatus Limnocylindrales bacterium]